MVKTTLVALLVVSASFSYVMAMGNGKRRVTIDEILGRAEKSRRHRGIAGNRGQNSLLRTLDNKAVITEYDIANPLPTEEGEKILPRPSRGGNRRGGGNGRGGKNAQRKKRNATPYQSRRWPSNTVHISINENEFTSAERTVIENAWTEYSKYTCIKIETRTSQTDYVNIIRDGGSCYSYVGKIGGAQSMSLGNGCAFYKQTAVHEMMHALGVYHQHTRPDRNSYVTIHSQNIQSGLESNFAIKQASEVVLENTAYSYRSVMHYGQYAFTSNGSPTITTTNSAFQNIIGTSPTFSFEDIQLITSIYNCNSGCPPANCPPGSFQGQNCTCYCKSTADPNIPVVNCGEFCVNPDQACTCASRPNACSGIPNSQCDATSGECRCSPSSQYVNHNNVCTLISSITCTELGVDCKCSLNSGSCANGIPNSSCNSASNTCFCPAGFAPNNAGTECMNINSTPCDEADKSCFCSQKGAGACNGVPNSSCDSATDSCKCDEDFYNNNGVCTAAPACTTLNQPCRCSVQGSDACTALQFTVCDSTSDACICDPGTHTEQNGACVNANQFISNGLTVAPFIHSSSSTTNFAPTQGTDTTAFGISSNGWFLYASGTGSGDVAAIETPPIDPEGYWCVEYAVMFTNAYIYTRYTYNGVNWGYSSVYTPGVISYFYERPTFRVYNYSFTNIKFQIMVIPYSNAAWSAALDPVKVYKC